MAYFAKVNPTENPNIYIVEQNIRITQEELNTGLFGNPNDFVQNDYNTFGNVHYAPSPPAEPRTPDGGTPFRANYAGIGYTFDTSYTINDVVGVFYAPQPYPSWILNTQTFLWEAPTPKPTDGNYYWDELTQSWIKE